MSGCGRMRVVRGVAGLAVALLGACADGPAREDGPAGEARRGGEGRAARGEDVGEGDARPAPPYHALFEQTHLPVFEITIAPEALTALNAAGIGNSEYQRATLRYGDFVLDDVGVRLKGRASFQPVEGKPGLKIKVNEFVRGQRLLGLERLTLNNMVQDPALVRERLGYMVYRAMGVPAPLANHARLYINGEYSGLYANLQSIDEQFIREHWPGAVGNLYDMPFEERYLDLDRRFPWPWEPRQETRFELSTNTVAEDRSDLSALIDAASGSWRWQFVRRLEEVLDLSDVLDLAAVQAVIADWDGYFGAANNYLLYHVPSHGRFVIVPWGIDQTFGVRDGHYEGADYRIDHGNSGRERGLIQRRCEGIDACRARYMAAVARALDVFESLGLEAELDRMLRQVGGAIDEDMRKPVNAAEHAAALADLRHFLRNRAGRVRAQLP